MPVFLGYEWLDGRLSHPYKHEVRFFHDLSIIHNILPFGTLDYWKLNNSYLQLALFFLDLRIETSDWYLKKRKPFYSSPSLLIWERMGHVIKNTKAKRHALTLRA